MRNNRENQRSGGAGTVVNDSAKSKSNKNMAINETFDLQPGVNPSNQMSTLLETNKATGVYNKRKAH